MTGETKEPAASETDPAEELEVLFPDVELTVNDPETGEAVGLTVREFRFREGLEAQALGRDLIAALAAHAADEAAPALDTVAVDALIGERAGAWVALCAMACGRDAEWLERLRERDARAVSSAMWEVNNDFFFERIAAAAAAARRLSRSPRSSTSSCGPDTDEGTPSSASA